MKILPLYVPKNAFFFVAPEYYPGMSELLAPNWTVYTAPLRFNQGIPFTELATSDELVEQELIHRDWTIDPEGARLGAVWFKLPGQDELITSNVGLEVTDARFRPMDRDKEWVLNIDRKTIPVIIGAAEIVAWLDLEHRKDTPLGEMVDHDMYVRLNIDITGAINMTDGHVSMLNSGDTRVHSVLDSRGRTLDTSEGLTKRIKEYFSQLMAIGYALDVNWLKPDAEQHYEYEMVEACSAGKGLALLVKGVVGAYEVEGYSADIVEPTASTYGTTTLYLQTQRATSDHLKPRSWVIVEENNGLQPGWVNVEFFSMNEQVGQMQSLGRFERIAPHYVGHWAGAIGMFLINGDYYGVNDSLPALVPKLTTYTEIQANPETFISLLGESLIPPSME